MDSGASFGDTVQLNPNGNLDRIDQRMLPLNQIYEFSTEGQACTFG